MVIYDEVKNPRKIIKKRQKSINVVFSADFIAVLINRHN